MLIYREKYKKITKKTIIQDIENNQLITNFLTIFIKWTILTLKIITEGEISEDRALQM